ncbi:MAG: acyl-[ACP]--phospholipid O-acyltransferase [Planctomycetaceae bacterium]
MNRQPGTIAPWPRDGLASRSFLGLLATQFLGAMNDNLLRWLVVLIAKPMIGTSQALPLGLACFTLPYLLLASPAGFLADRFSKRTVIVGCKVAEIAIMALGIVAILMGNVWSLFIVVALMGSQSALFGPSKFGSIPEILRPEKLSKGNGLMGLITVVASAAGSVGGYWLYSLTTPSLDHPAGLASLAPAAITLIGVAIVGWVTSLMIAPLPAADPSRPMPGNPIAEIRTSLALLGRNRSLFLTALGIAFFWFLGSLAQMNIDSFGNDELSLDHQEIGLLLGILVLGAGCGSVLAGLWSGDRVELGIVPLGAAGISISSLCLWLAGASINPSVPSTSESAYLVSCVLLFLLGISAGLFNIPLEAFLQHRSDHKTRGTILAASNFVSFAFMLGAAGLFFLMQHTFGMTASQIFFVAGLGTIPVVIYALVVLPQATIRMIVWLLAHTMYRVRVSGRENLPPTGGALLVSNHVSWLDGVLLLMTSSRPIRMIAYADYVTTGFVGWMSRIFRVIPIQPHEGPKALLRSLQTAQEAIKNGELVCIFAEGSITRTGQLQPFQRGVMRIVQGTNAPVIPVFLDELWGSVFSFRGGKFFWKRPRRWPYPVSITFGSPVVAPKDITEIRQAVQHLGVESVLMRKGRQMVPPRLFLRKCRESLFRSKVADSSGADLTGGKLLAATLMFRRLLSRKIIGPDEEMVGILLPPSVGGVIANTAVTMMRRVVVNLNYTLSNDDVNFCIRECKIKHVLTSRKFLEKRPFDLEAEVVCLEDLKPQISAVDKILALAQAYLLPAFVLERLHGLTQIKPDDLLTVIFTSGSTGEPKGVMLSHSNIYSNCQGVDESFHFDKTDVMLGVLPFFHSFGYTGTLWVVLTLDPKGVYHFNPLDAREIGKLCEQHRVTITLSTPTFLRSYLKRCTKEQMQTLDLVILGAEKMPLDLAREFEEKFGVLPSEGYGTTELSPVAAVNIPDHRSGSAPQSAMKFGTVGRPFPGVMAKVVDPDTGRDLGINNDGLLWIKGPNVMKGYLNQPEKTAAVIKDGWYNTGDIARIDDDGFMQITGRQSRFSKIGGEMVPHIRLEEILTRIVGDSNGQDADDGMPEVQLAVTAVPDEKKGERIVVIHKPLTKPVNEILEELAETGLPNLWLPSSDSFVEVAHVPVLGTGKLDLKGLKEMALEKFAPAKAAH